MKNKWICIIAGILLPLIVFTRIYCAEGQGDKIYRQSVFNGFVDLYGQDDLNPINTPDCLNLWFDDYNTNAAVARRGSILANTSPFTGNLWIRNLYDYKQQNGTEYLVAQSSGSVLVSKDTVNFTSIISSTSIITRFDFTTAKDYLYGCNGAVVFKSNGQTVTFLGISNSTGVPTTATFMSYINNRMWYGGMPATPSRLYYSELNDPDNIQPQDYLDINVADGDYFTGIMGYLGVIYATKRYSTWFPDEVAANIFQVKAVDLNIGCLYKSTMQVQKGYPIWMSWRGIELYDGQFELISKPINNTILALNQLYPSLNVIVQESAADWSAGSGVNIDTTTVLGEIKMSQSFITGTTFYISVGSNTTNAWETGTLVNIDTATYSSRIAIKTLSSYQIQNSSISWGTATTTNIDTTTTLGSFKLAASTTNIALNLTTTSDSGNNKEFGNDGNYSTTWTSSVQAVSFYGSYTFYWKVDLGSIQNIAKITGLAGDAYDNGSSSSNGTFSDLSLQGSTNNSSWITIASRTGTSAWNFLSTTPCSYRYLKITITLTSTNISPCSGHLYVTELQAFSYSSSGNLITKSFDFINTPSSWGVLMSNYTLPAGSTVTFQTRTSADNNTWSGWVSATTGTTIPSALNRYLEVNCSLNPNATNSPVVSSIGVSSTAITGSYTTPILDFSQSPSSWGVLTSNYVLFDKSNPNYTNPSGSISFLTQSSTNNANWSGFTAATIGSTIPSPLGRYLQIEALLSPSTDYAQTPVITSLTANAGFTGTSYTTQILKAGSNWAQWGVFVANDDTDPPTSLINYYVKTATTSALLTTATPVSVANGSIINSANAPYIQVISSFTTFDSSQNPALGELQINYYGSSNMIPCSCVYKDRYYLSISTADSSNSVNNCLLIYDYLGSWTKHTGNWGSCCLWRLHQYSGDSTQGNVYLQDVANTYTDNGNSYQSYWVSKVFDMRELDPANTWREKDFLDLWTLAAQQNSGSLDIYYRLDGSQNPSDWTYFDTISLVNADALIISKSIFQSTHSKFIQIKFQANNNFTLKGYTIRYQVEPIQ